MPHPAMARREEGAHGQVFDCRETPPDGMDSGPQCEGILDPAPYRLAFLRFAQYAFIRLETALLAAALIVDRVRVALG